MPHFSIVFSHNGSSESVNLCYQNTRTITTNKPSHLQPVYVDPNAPRKAKEDIHISFQLVLVRGLDMGLVL